jgi:hypothetical protein
MPTPRFLPAVEAAGDGIYAIGSAATDFTSLAAVETFSP